MLNSLLPASAASRVRQRIAGACGTALIALQLTLAAAAGTSAQELSLRIAAGPAIADRAGASALAGLQLGSGSAVGRLEVRGTATGRSADWEESARVIMLAGAAGLRTSDDGRPRRYLLATLGEGLDPREADRVTALGMVLGSDLVRGGRWFAEARYEHWLQHGVEHHDLPGDFFALLLGFAVR